jgi:hypothetical protein
VRGRRNRQPPTANLTYLPHVLRIFCPSMGNGSEQARGEALGNREIVRGIGEPAAVFSTTQDGGREGQCRADDRCFGRKLKANRKTAEAKCQSCPLLIVREKRRPSASFVQQDPLFPTGKSLERNRATRYIRSGRRGRKRFHFTRSSSN